MRYIHTQWGNPSTYLSSISRMNQTPWGEAPYATYLEPQGHLNYVGVKKRKASIDQNGGKPL